MTDSQKTTDVPIKLISIKLADDWQATAVSSLADFNLTEQDWLDCLKSPQALIENFEKTLKSHNLNRVGVKTLKLKNKNIEVVVKYHCPPVNLRQFFRSFRPGRGPANFKTALEMTALRIAVPTPLAALSRRRFLVTRQSIYLSEYCQNSINLYEFLASHLPQDNLQSFAVKKQLSDKIASTLVRLHRKNLQHKDAKPTNFLVTGQNNAKCDLLIADLDGIKPYSLCRNTQRYRSLWRLASDLMALAAVNRTDYLRTFLTYCNLTGIDNSRRKALFRTLAKKARIKYKDKQAVLAKENI